jgi:hypothetical protein
MRHATALVILATAGLLALVGWASYRHNRTIGQSTLWSVNLFLGGEDLRLFDSGRYESLAWGDLPPYRPTWGTWRIQGHWLYLVPDEHRRPIRMYRRIRKFGCTFFRRPGLSVPSELFPSGITPADFSLEGSGCRQIVERYDERARHPSH